MDFDSYGKKHSLPIHKKLSPRKLTTHPIYRKYSVGLLIIIALFWLLSSKKEGKDTEVATGSDNSYNAYTIGREGNVLEQLEDDSVESYDLADYTGSAGGSENKEIVLLLMPLRNAENVLPMAFRNIMNLSYPHSLIDIAFLVSDCTDGDATISKVFEYSSAMQNSTLHDKLKKEDERKKRKAEYQELYINYMDQKYIDHVRKSYENAETYNDEYHKPFRSITVFKKDFGQLIGQGFSDRHAVKVQAIRRKLMGRARNWLTSNALKPYHSWVYWRDVDIEMCPGSIIQDMMKHNLDVMVPNVWRPLPEFLGSEQAYDLNAWEESEAAIELAKSLDEDDVIVEGYAEYPTWRVHLAYLRSSEGDPDEVMPLDGVGGVSILAKAKIFRQGAHFPAFSFLNHAETEAFGKMVKAMGYQVAGFPHYTVWHIYEPSEDDLQSISKFERQRRRQGES